MNRRAAENNSMLDPSAQNPTPTSLLPLLYAGDQQYGWSAGMRAVTHALLDMVALPDGPVVEIGCGGGQFLVDLQRQYPDRLVVGADLHPLALANARNLLPPPAALIQTALPDLPWAENSFALVLALDVFDQQGVDLPAAVAQAYRLLRPGGALLMRVSAHPRLYGAHDRAFHTGQRYTHTQVFDAFAQTSFALQRLTYANTILAAPVAALRLAQRWGLVPWQPDTYQYTYFHHFAAWILRQEAIWLQEIDLPWGLSLCALAHKW